MNRERGQIDLPRELIEEIDAAVGRMGRTGFLMETARAELLRRRVAGVADETGVG